MMSKIIDKVWSQVKECQNRPFEAINLIIPHMPRRQRSVVVKQEVTDHTSHANHVSYVLPGKSRLYHSNAACQTLPSSLLH